MTNALNIAIEPADEAFSAWVHAGLGAFNRAAAERSERQYFHVALRDDEGQLRGGLIGSVRFDVMNIQDLFLEDGYRRGGYGARLVAIAEEEARRRGARLSCVTTFSWQARPFYEKQGYKVFAELPYLDGAHALYWLRKSLCA